MGCGCQGGSSINAVNPVTAREPIESDECIYSIEQVNEWLSKVECAKKAGVYTQMSSITSRQLNSYIGILLSAKNYASNICYFKNELQEIENFIIVLTLTNLCNS